MQVSAVYRCVDLISSKIASMTMRLETFNRAERFFYVDNRDSLSRHINYLLGMRPNWRMNSFVFMRTLVSQLLLQGNAYVWPVRGGDGTVSALILLSPGSVVFDKYNNTYHVNDPINKIFVSTMSDGIIHVKNTCQDGYLGLSTLEYARKTFTIAATADNETLKRFATGGRIKAFLRNNNTVTGFGEYQDDELNSLAKDIQDALHSGNDIITIPGDGVITPMSMTSADLQFLDERKFTVREIARFFGVPVRKLMEDTASNYKSAEQDDTALYSECLQPLMEGIEREFNAKLLNEDTYLDYRYIFDITTLLALDITTKSAYNKARLETGQASINDLRREAGVAPVKDGDKIYISTNLAELGSQKLSGGTNNNGNASA